MSDTNYEELVLTCGSWQEAQAIADVLLEKRLVADVELMETKPQDYWQGNHELVKEIKLVIQTVANKLEDIEIEVKKVLKSRLPKEINQRTDRI